VFTIRIRIDPFLYGSGSALERLIPDWDPAAFKIIEKDKN